MTITTSGRIAFSDILAEFGTPSEGFSGITKKDSIDAFRVSENIGSLTGLPLDTGVPKPGSPIKFSDFYGKRLNIVVYYTPTNIGLGANFAIGNLNAYNTYVENNSTRVRVLGGYTDRPIDPTDKRIIINVNRFLASQKATGRATFNDSTRRKCAIRTGNWSATPPASMVLEIGSGGEIYGAGGDGGNAESRSNPLPLVASGLNGSSAIGIEYPTIVVNRGYIQCGFGGGGAGGWNRYSNNNAWSGGGGGGGAAGAAQPGTSGPVPFYIPGAGGFTAGFLQDPPGTDGVVGSSGATRTAGAGGAGGANNVAGAGGTGGYYSATQNGWDLRYARFTNRFVAVGAVDGSPEGVFWHPEGIHAYLVGQSNYINRYTAAVPWEANSLVYDGASFRLQVNTQDGTPCGVFLKPDGTRLWMAGNNNSRIYQYDLSIPWNIASGVYNSVSLSVATQGTGLHDLWWKPDGSAVYALTNSNDRIIQFDIASPANYWNVGSAVFTTGAFFDISAIDTEPLGMCFKPDGTKLYVAGQQRDRIYEFTLSTPWQINNTGGVTPTTAFSNATHRTLYVGTQDGGPRGVFIRQDNGESLYMTGTGSNRIYQYSLSSQYGGGGGVSQIYGAYPGYPGFSVVSTSSTMYTLDPTSTGTIIGLTTIGAVAAYV